MEKKLQELNQIVGGKLSGDGQQIIKGVAGIRDASKNEITFLANEKYIADLKRTDASAIIVSHKIHMPDKNLIRVENPYLAFAKILKLFTSEKETLPRVIHKTSVIGERVKLGSNIGIGACTVIGDDVSIGDNSLIFPGVYIGNKTKIQTNVVIYPNVMIREEINIGNNAIIHSGTVIGSDGFGFVTHDKKHAKIPQSGTVIIEDDVEIGANVTIDRGTIGATRIGQGTKIDNLVQIAHNVDIGKNCLIVAQVGISGSSKISDNVTIAGQAGVVGHISIGENTIVAGRAGVTRSVPAGQVVSGFPARPHSDVLKQDAQIKRIPQLFKKYKELEKRLNDLENK